MARDSQRQAVYDWEESVAPLSDQMLVSMDLDECRSIVEKVWGDYRPDDLPPVVTHGQGNSCATGSRTRIRLPKKMRKMHYVLHEVAHSLLSWQIGHGPIFASLVLDLWENYCDLPRPDALSMGMLQKPRKVRFADATDVPRPIKMNGWQPLVSYKVDFDSVIDAVRRFPSLKQKHGAELLTDVLEVGVENRRRPELLLAELRELFGLGVDANGGKNKRIPLVMASALVMMDARYEQVVHLLLANGADPNFRDEERCVMGHVLMYLDSPLRPAQMLVEAGAIVDEVDREFVLSEVSRHPTIEHELMSLLSLL